MHPALEQHWEIKKAGKHLRDLEGEYRAAQQSSKSSDMKPQHETKKGSHTFQQPLGVPRQTKPPVNPEELKRLLDKEREAETARRNALSRFHEAQRGLPKSAIREVTNPCITRRPNEQNPGGQRPGNVQSPSNLQPPTGPSRGRQSGNRQSGNNLNQSGNQPSNQQWPGPQPPSGPSRGGHSGNRQSGNNLNQLGNQQWSGPQPPSGPSRGHQSGHRQFGNNSNQQSNQQWTGYQATSLPSHSRQSGSNQFQSGHQHFKPHQAGNFQAGNVQSGHHQFGNHQAGNHQSGNHHSGNHQFPSNPSATHQPHNHQWRNKKKKKRHSGRSSHAGTPRPSPAWQQQPARHNQSQNKQFPVNQAQGEQQQPVWNQQPPAQDQVQAQNLSLNTGGPQNVKQERGGSPEVKEEDDDENESDIEITGWRVLKPARSAQRAAAPEVNNNNLPPQPSAAVTHPIETPRQLAYRPLPTPTSLGASTPGSQAPPRSQAVQPAAEPTPTPAADPLPTVMLDRLFAMQISLAERLDEFVNRNGQMYQVETQQQQVGKRAPRRVPASTENEVNQQRTGVTEDMEYIFAPVRGYSDDSNDGTYAPSPTPGEEEVVLRSIEADESDELDNPDKPDVSEEPEEAEEPNLPAGPSTPPRQKGKGKRKATEWSISPSPVRVKKPRRREKETKAKETEAKETEAKETEAKETEAKKKKAKKKKEKKERKTKAKETPVPVPFLERALRERARVDALVQANLSAKLRPYH